MAGRWNRWWWILAIPGVLLGIPMLYIGMATGSRLLSTLIGPVNVWNTTSEKPSPHDLQGSYQMSDGGRRAAKGVVSERSGFKLGPGSALEVIDLPRFDGFGEPSDCHYNGTGTWSLYQTGSEIQLDMELKKSVLMKREDLQSCAPENFGLMIMLGNAAPYRFWYVIGDPDEDEGLLYRRTGP